MEAVDEESLSFERSGGIGLRARAGVRGRVRGRRRFCGFAVALIETWNVHWWICSVIACEVDATIGQKWSRRYFNS